MVATAAKGKVLIVEDDESILVGLRLNLELEGYEIVEARDGPTGIRQHEEQQPDLVLLDVMLPHLDGYGVLRQIRSIDPVVPVVLLTAKDAQADKVAGLDHGADDYITKPFALPELLARINAVLRRARRQAAETETVSFGAVVIDRTHRRVTKSQEAVELTTREFDLLSYLATRPDRVMSRGQILEAVWGDEYEGTERTVDNVIVRLRQKLEDRPEEPAHILTVRGVGYRFVP